MSYPILYSATETNFSNNGLGILGDCVSCDVTEEANGIFELAMQYPMGGIHYEDIVDRAIIKSKADQFRDPQLFRVYAISKPMSGVVTVLAEHISYDLSGIPVSPFSAQNAPAALSGLKSNAVVDCPFEFWTDKDTSGEFIVSVPSSIRSRLGGVTGSILDVYGGEFEFDNYTVKLHNNRGMNRGVSIRYGKNLTDIKQEQNCASIATGIYPYWSGDVDGNSVLVELPEKIINAPGTYNFVRIRTLDLSSEFEKQPTVDQLRAKAKNYVESNNIGIPTVSLSVSFAQLEQSEEYKGLKLLERVSLFDTVNVEFTALGVSATAKAVKLIYDALADRVKSITLGSVKANIADTIVEQQQEIAKAPTKTELERAKEAATSWLTNGKGYAYFRKDDLGNIVDILFMDTQDTSTAVNVMRVGQSGIGFSHNGVNGPYESAWTIDGRFVADFITTGNLNATLIRAGVLQDKTGKVFSLDLDGGTLDANFNSLKISGRSTDEISKDIANDVTDGKLKEYSTTVQMQSAIDQSASSIKLEVSETYSTKEYVDNAKDSAVDTANSATDGKLANYSTTVQMQSAIEQSAKKISLSVTNNGTSSVLTLSYDGTTLSSQNVEISGFVTFSSLSTSGQSTINGDNITTGTISAELVSAASSGGRVQIYSGTIKLYDKNDIYRVGLFTSTANNGVLKFNDEAGDWCGDLYGYKDNNIGIVQLNLSSNGFFRTRRIQTSEIAIGNMKCFCDGYKALNGSAFVYLDGSSRVGCFEKLAIAGSAAQDVRWVWSSTVGGWLLTTSTSLN